MRRISFLLSLLFFCGIVHAQTPPPADAGGGTEKNSGNPQIGAFVGRVLPNGIPGSTNDIFSMWGMRYSRPMGKGGGYMDFGGDFAHSGGVQWTSFFTGISMHIPVETLIGHAGIGFDLTRYKTDTYDHTRNMGGGHFIGGVMSHIGGNVLARFDMKLNSKPGTSLFFGAGIVIELDGKSDNGSGSE